MKSLIRKEKTERSVSSVMPLWVFKKIGNKLKKGEELRIFRKSRGQVGAILEGIVDE